MIHIAENVSLALAQYFAIGAVFALYFVSVAATQDGVSGRSLRVRAMLFPGAVLLWPLLLFKGKPQ